MNKHQFTLLVPDSANQFSQESQARTQWLLDQVRVGVFHTDRNGRYVFVNAWFCHLKEAQREEFLGKTAEEVAASKSHGAWEDTIRFRAKKMFNRVCRHKFIIESGQTLEFEECYLSPEGNKRYFQVIEGPLLGSDGGIIGSQGILFDGTERKWAEAQLGCQRQMLRTLMESSEDAIYFKDLHSRFTRCSPGVAAYLKSQTADEAIGKTDFDFFGEERARLSAEEEQGIIRSGQPIIGKIERETCREGRVTWALTSKMPFYDDAGQIIGILGISKDITAIKNMEAKLEELHLQLWKASRQMGMSEVATSILHNVGNVLNSVNVSVELLLGKAKRVNVANLCKAISLLNENLDNLPKYFTDDPKGKQLPAYLALVSEQLANDRQDTLKEIENLQENIEHIKKIVALQQNYAKASGVIETCQVPDLVEDALRMNADALIGHDFALVREYAEVPSIAIEKHKVLQVLVNLIRNAKHACDESGKKDKQITLRICRRDQQICIAVVDNGIGIAPENRARIFTHGFTTRKDGHGFGLHSGLLAAREMGGTLIADSEGIAAGATFTLELPIHPPVGPANLEKSSINSKRPTLPPPPQLQFAPAEDR